MNFFKRLFGSGRDTKPAATTQTMTPHYTKVLVKGGQPWFEPRSEPDRRVTGFEHPMKVVEIDFLPVVAEVLPRLACDALCYQHWKYGQGQGRAYVGLDSESAAQLGAGIQGSSIHSLALVVTDFSPGSIRDFARALSPHRLKTLGLFWYLSGSDLTDSVGPARTMFGQPCVSEEIAEAARLLQVERLRVLTGAFNEQCDAALAESLKGLATLKRCDIFLKDDTHAYPPAVAHKLQRVLTGL